MTRRIIAFVGTFAAGLVGGFGFGRTHDLEQYFDLVATAQCSKGGRTTWRQRPDELPKADGVQDWIFFAHCDRGGPAPNIKINYPDSETSI